MKKLLLTIGLVFASLGLCHGKELSFWDRVEVLRQRSCGEQNQTSDYYHTQWCGLERVVKVSESVDSRIKAYEKELANDGLSEARLFQILVSLKYIYKYEYKSDKDYLAVSSWLEQLSQIYRPARLELLISNFKSAEMLTLEGNGELREMLGFVGHFPYDNGYLPEITQEYLTFMAIVSDMAVGQKSNLAVPAGYFGFGGLPLKLLYDWAFDRHDAGYTQFLELKKGGALQKMLEGVLQPMYMPVRPTERRFLAGLAASELFESEATELFLDCVTTEPRLRAMEQGLGVLASHYKNIGAYAEAVSVLESLAKYYPSSDWLCND